MFVRTPNTTSFLPINPSVSAFSIDPVSVAHSEAMSSFHTASPPNETPLPKINPLFDPAKMSPRCARIYDAQLFGNKAHNLSLMRADETLCNAIPEFSAVTARESAEQTGQAANRAIHEIFEQIDETASARNGRSAPMLVAVRSSPVRSKPGLFDTVINVGLVQADLKTLADSTIWDFVLSTYVSFLRSYAQAVHRMKRDDWLEIERIASDGKDALEKITLYLNQLTIRGITIPDTPEGQMEACLKSIGSSVAKSEDGGGVIVERMVFGNLSSNSFSGILFTADPDTGNGHRCVSKSMATGPEVVTGAPDGTNETSRFDEGQVVAVGKRVSALLGAPQDIEFVIEDGTIYVTQSRDIVFANQKARVVARFQYDLGNGRDQIEAFRMISEDDADNRHGSGEMVMSYAFSNMINDALILQATERDAGRAAIGTLIRWEDYASLTGAEREGASYVIWADDPYDTDLLIALANGEFSGLISERDHSLSHAAIMARASRIPYLYDVKRTGKKFQFGDRVLIDERSGKAAVDAKGEFRDYLTPMAQVEKLSAIQLSIIRNQVFFDTEGLSLPQLVELHNRETEYFLDKLGKGSNRFDDMAHIKGANLRLRLLHQELRRREAGIIDTVLYSKDAMLSTFQEYHRDNGFCSFYKEILQKFDEYVETGKFTEYMLSLPSVQELQREYGDRLKFRYAINIHSGGRGTYPVVRAQAYITSERPPLFQERLRLRGSGIGHFGDHGVSKDSHCTAIEMAIEAARRIQRENPGSSIVTYETMDELHDRGVLAWGAVIMVLHPSDTKERIEPERYIRNL